MTGKATYAVEGVTGKATHESLLRSSWYARALSGEFTESPSGPWAVLYDALLWHARGTGTFPSIEHVRSSPPDVVALVALEAARRGFLSFSRAALSQWEIVVSGPAGSMSEVVRPLIASYRQLLEADALDGEALRRCEARAAKLELPALVVEAATLRSWAAQRQGRPRQALDIARRASRMAQVEGFPQQEYLASLALAEMRREMGLPHLALHISTGLGEVAPPQWKRRISIARLLAGCVDASDDEFAETWRSVMDGSRERMAEGFDALAALGPEFEALASTLRPLIDCDYDVDASVPWSEERIRPWLGVALRASTPYDGALATLLVDTDRVRRVLSCGAPLAAGPLLGAGRPGRTEKGISTLALAGSTGMSREAFVESVYGFAFDRAAHKGPLEVLVHRMRTILDEHATIERCASMLTLRVHSPFKVLDARHPVPLSAHILRALSHRPDLSARRLASELGYSRRRIQQELRALSEDGVCVRKEGGNNRVVYRLEDTTFSSPHLPVPGV